MKNKQIVAGEGIGEVKFGITRPQLKKILGEPSEIEQYAYEDDEESQAECWHYDSLELSASFEEEHDWRLVAIAVSSPEFTYKGESLIGSSEEELLDTLKTLGLKDLTVEDLSTKETPDHKLVRSEYLDINFWLDNGKLAEIQFAPLFDDDYNVVWP